MKQAWLILGLTAYAVVAAGPAAKEKEAKTTETAAKGEVRLDGVIVRSNQKVSTLDVRKGNITRTVHYDDSTRWTKAGKAAEMGEFTDGARVNCLGKYDEKKQFHATQIDLRKPGGGRFH